MGCILDEDMIQGYLDDTLDPLEEIILKEHMRECSDCKRELTEMKLLYWELNGLKNIEIEVPAEAEIIRKDVLEKLASMNTGKFGVKELLELQKQIRRNAGNYINYIPGLSAGTNFFQNGLKKATSVVYMSAKKALLNKRKSFVARLRI